MPVEANDGAPVLWPKDLRTYDVRYELSTLGATYDRATQQWTIPSDRYAEAQSLIEGVTQPSLRYVWDKSL